MLPAGAPSGRLFSFPRKTRSGGTPRRSDTAGLLHGRRRKKPEKTHADKQARETRGGLPVWLPILSAIGNKTECQSAAFRHKHVPEAQHCRTSLLPDSGSTQKFRVSRVYTLVTHAGHAAPALLSNSARARLVLGPWTIWQGAFICLVSPELWKPLKSASEGQEPLSAALGRTGVRSEGREGERMRRRGVPVNGTNVQRRVFVCLLQKKDTSV